MFLPKPPPIRFLKEGIENDNDQAHVNSTFTNMTTSRFVRPKNYKTKCSLKLFFLFILVFFILVSAVTNSILLRRYYSSYKPEVHHLVTHQNHPNLRLHIDNSNNATNSHLHPTIIVQLRGELGNHISTIAHGYGIQLYALQNFNLETNLVLRHQVQPDGITSNPKWLPTSEMLQQCFHTFRDWDFSRGGTFEQQQQVGKGLSNLEQKRMDLINGRHMNGMVYRDTDRQPIQERDIEIGIQEFINVLRKRDTVDTSLHSYSMDNNVLIDKYFQYFKTKFRIKESCCGDIRPFEDESVFHFRNFKTEMPNAKYTTLQEVSPDQAADTLFGHLQKGDKLAITTRFHNELVQEYERTLTARGIQVRIIQGNTGIQDFCFLLNAKKELIGNFQSTYVFWAAILGKSQKAVLYTLNTPSLQNRYGQTINDRFLYQWENQELRRRIFFKLIE